MNIICYPFELVATVDHFPLLLVQSHWSQEVYFSFEYIIYTLWREQRKSSISSVSYHKVASFDNIHCWTVSSSFCYFLVQETSRPTRNWRSSDMYLTFVYRPNVSTKLICNSVILHLTEFYNFSENYLPVFTYVLTYLLRLIPAIGMLNSGEDER